jgi:hypothetical protein
MYKREGFGALACLKLSSRLFSLGVGVQVFQAAQVTSKPNILLPYSSRADSFLSDCCYSIFGFIAFSEHVRPVNNKISQCLFCCSAVRAYFQCFIKGAVAIGTTNFCDNFFLLNDLFSYRMIFLRINLQFCH